MDALAPGHLAVMAIVAFVVFFGWKQLPDAARSLGRSLRLFKSEVHGGVGDGGIGDAVRSVVVDTRAELSTTHAATRAALTTAEKDATDVS